MEMRKHLLQESLLSKRGHRLPSGDSCALHLDLHTMWDRGTVRPHRSGTHMSVEENIHLMRRWFKEVWNDGKTETVYALLAPDAVARGQRDAEGELRGPDEFAEFVNVIRGAFPDMKLKIEDIFGS